MTVAPVRLVPRTVTRDTPFLAVVGVNELTVGAGGVTVKDSVVNTEPAPVVTLMTPDSAPVGTVTVREVALLETIFPVLLPPKTTLVAFRFLPVKVTFWPTLAALVKSLTTAAW